jgi:hypothetical protein
MTKDTALLIGQVAVLIVLGALVALGHDSSVTDALLVVSGSLTGSAAIEKLKGKSTP